MTDKFRDQDRLTELEREVQAQRSQLQRLPLREVLQEFGDVTVILGLVDEVSGVSGGDATFQVDNVDLIFGDDPRLDPSDMAEEVTFNNTFAQIYADNDKVLGWRRTDTGNFETEKFTGSGITIYRFTFTEDMSLADEDATAILLDDTGAVIAPTITINVVDTEKHILGKTTYVGADGSGQIAFNGYALKFTDDYNATGNPGAHILSVEGFASIIAVRLDANVTASGTFPATLIDAPSLPAVGSNYAGRIPSSPLLVSNSALIASGAQQGEQWLAGLVQKKTGETPYELICPIRRRLRRFILVTEISPITHAAEATDVDTQETITVVDFCGTLTGLGNYAGANATAQPGYCGISEQFTDDFQGTQRPGCNIVSIEGPEPLVAVVLNSDVVSTGATVAQLVLNIPSTSYGSNYSSRVPEGFGAGLMLVWNSANLAKDAKSGEQWMAMYHTDSRQYELVHSLEAGGGGQTIVVLINGSIGPASISSGGVNPGIGSGFRLTASGSNWVDAGEGTLTLQNHSESTIEGPTSLRATKIEGQWVLDMFNMNALRNADQSEYQVAWKKSGDKDWQLESIEDFVSASPQPIHHPAGGDDLRFKDTVECT